MRGIGEAEPELDSILRRFDVLDFGAYISQPNPGIAAMPFM